MSMKSASCHFTCGVATVRCLSYSIYLSFEYKSFFKPSTTSKDSKIMIVINANNTSFTTKIICVNNTYNVAANEKTANNEISMPHNNFSKKIGTIVQSNHHVATHSLPVKKSPLSFFVQSCTKTITNPIPSSTHISIVLRINR